MPYFGNTDPRTYDRPAQGFGASEQQAAQSADRVVGRDFNAAQTLGYYALGTASDVVDTVGSSLSAILPGSFTERGEFNRFVTRSLDLPGLNDFMYQNRGGIEAASGVALVIASELAARKITAPGSALMAGLRKTPYLRRIAALDEQAAAAMQTVRAAREEVAGMGFTGAAQLRTQVMVDTAVFDGVTGTMIPSTIVRSSRQADKIARGFGAAIGARSAVTAEAVLGTVANQNGFLYDDSEAYNIAFVGAGIGIGAAVGRFGVGYQLRKIANEQSISRRMAGALDPEGLEEKRLGSLFSGAKAVGGKDADETIDWFGGSFTDEVGQLGLEADALKNAPLTGAADPNALKGNRLAAATPIRKQQRDLMQKVTTKGIPSDGRSSFSMDTPGYGNHIDTMLDRDPMAMNLVENVGGTGDELLGTTLIDGFFTRVARDTNKVESQIKELVESINARGVPTPKQEALLQKLQLKRRRLSFQNNLTAHGIIDGELVPPSALATIERFTPVRVFPKRLDADKVFWEVEAESKHGAGILIGDNLEVVLPKKNGVVVGPGEPSAGTVRMYRSGEGADGGWHTTSLAYAKQLAARDKTKIFYQDVAESFLRKNGGDSFFENGKKTTLNLELPAGMKGTLLNEKAASNPTIAQLASLDYFDHLATYRIADTAIDSLARKADATIALPKNPSYLQLDMAEELLTRTQGAAKVMFPQGMTRETAQVESFVQKAEALKKAQLKGKPSHLSQEEWAHQLRVRLNLPRLTAYESGLLGQTENAAEFLLRALGNQSPEAARSISLPEMKEAVAASRRLGDAANVSGKDVESLYGNSFRFMKDDAGREMKPLVALTRPFSPQTWTRDNVAERLAMRKQKALEELMSESSHPLVRELTEAGVNSPDFQLASRPDLINEASLQGSVVGSVPQSFFGALTKELKATDWNFRDVPAILGATRLNDLFGRITRARMKETIEGAFGDSLKLLKNPRNAPSKLLLNQFHSFRGGWDIAQQPIERTGAATNRRWVFKLEKTVENQARWKKLYDESMPEGATLRGPNKQEIVLDDTALDLQKRFNAASREVITMQNSLLRAYGMAPIREQSWYVPPPEVAGKFVGWVMGPDKKLLNVVVAETPDQFAIARDAAMKDQPLGNIFMPREQIVDYANIWDRVQMDMISPGTPAVLTGKRNVGGLTPANISLDAFQNSLKSIERRILATGDDTLGLLMKEQINAAKARSAFAKATSPGGSGKFGSGNYRTAHDYYLEALQGTSKSSAEGSIIGRQLRTAESGIDRGLAAVAGPTSRKWAELTDRLSRGTGLWSTGAAARRDFDSLVERLGPDMPFKSAIELGEARQRGATPLTMAKITGKVNQMTAAITLRIMEVAHPVMNLSGIVNAMPSVVRSMTPRAGEDTEAFAARIGHSAMIFRLPTGEAVAAPDITKMFGRALKSAWNRTSHPEFDFMMRRGYITQEVAEFHKQFGLIDAPSKAAERIGKAVEWSSKLSDKSEDFSRSIGHFIGLQVADLVGVTGRERQHAFAHDVANKMIANYNPANRPEVFQGAFGSMLGLFQSFAHNYYGRLFRYVETKDTRSFMTQYAIQSSLFGITGLTGWDQVSDLVGWASDGERRLDTGTQGAFTGPVGDVLAHGLISQVSRIFNLVPGIDSVGGVDLYSRGDTSVRLPGIDLDNMGLNAKNIPGLSAVVKIGSGIGEGLSALWKENPGLTITRLAEIASNMVVNRPIAGMIEQSLAHGNDTDSYGQIVSETKGFGEMFMRMAGVRSERQSNELTAYYSDKRAMEQQAAKKERLRLRTRAAIREGRDDMLPGIFEDYVTAGGDPRYFRGWMKRNYESATETVGTRRLDQLNNDPAAYADVMRYLDMGVGIEEDDTVGAEAEQQAAEPQQEIPEAY